VDKFDFGITRGTEQQTGNFIEKGKEVISCRGEMEQGLPLEEVVAGDVWGGNLLQDRAAIVYALNAVTRRRTPGDSLATK